MAVTPRTPRERRAPAVTREVMSAIDDVEARVAWILDGLGTLASLYLLYFVAFVGHQTFTYTRPAAKSGKCPTVTGAKFWHQVGDVCHYRQVTTTSGLLLAFGVVAGLTATMAIFTARRRRTGVVFTMFFEGLALATLFTGPVNLGLIFILAGIWMMYRAWRLQKYGVASMRATAPSPRKNAAEDSGGAPAELPAVPAEASPRRPPEASKRYTPKKPVKKKR